MEIMRAMIGQIGRMNLLAVSGGRYAWDESALTLTLPVSNGYRVEVEYVEGRDTYTVRRVFLRAGKRSIKQEFDDVYCDELSDKVYRASCFR